MKQFIKYFFIAAIAIFAFSCADEKENDDPPVPVHDGPSITAPTGATVLVGDVVEIDFVIASEAKIGEVTVSANEGTATVDAGGVIGNAEGTVTVIFTAPLIEGDKTVTLVVKDQQTPAKEATSTATVAVTVVEASSSDLLVAQFASAPVLDGTIDDMWSTAQKLESTAEVPSLGTRKTYLNSDGEGSEEDLDLFAPYNGEQENFTMRSGIYGDEIFFLIEWDDADDSKDRQSWYFDSTDKKWKGEHKYANESDDKFYEDKFAFLFPIGEVQGFSSASCYITCHTATTITTAKDKHTRHYLNGVDEKVDMWHWKRVRGTYNDKVDDQKMVYDDPAEGSGANGRGGDPDGGAGYANNSQTLNGVSVPKYVIPGGTDYYWIAEDDASAVLITGVDENGVLSYDGGTIDPTDDAAYAQGTGTMRIPSVITSAFTGNRADISVKAVHTGTGWIAELSRKLNTGDPYDVVFDPSAELPFGFAIFNNAAIAHAIKPGLTMKFEQ